MSSRDQIRFLVQTASRMEGRQQNSAGSGHYNSITLPSHPHNQAQTEVSGVKTPPGDSLSQGQGSASDILFPTSPQANVYDPRLFQDMNRPPNQSSNADFRVMNSQMLDPNLPGLQTQYPRPIRGPPNIAPGGYMLGNSAPNGGSTNARTNPSGSLADQFRRTLPIPRMQGFVPPSDQTSFTQGGRIQPSPLPTLLNQFERETSGELKQEPKKDENIKKEEAANAEHRTGIFAGMNFTTMSLEDLLALRKEYFGDYVRNSWTGPTGEVYDANNLPPALFQLEPSVDHPPRRLAFDHGFINGPDGLPVKGPNGRSIIKFPVLPRYISTDADGWCYEAWDRMDRGIEDSDYVSRMNADEFKLAQAIKKAQLMGSSKKQQGRRQSASIDYKKSERDLVAKNFINGINMRRTRAFRLPFGIFAWDNRSPKGDPSMIECQAVSGLSEESISHNTSLEVTAYGLQRVRIEGSYGEVRAKVNFEGQFWPYDMFLTTGKTHTPTPRLRECRKIALDLNEKLKRYNKKGWKDLPREELPASWFAKADKAKERVANKRKAEKGLDDTELSHDVGNHMIRGSKKARGHKPVRNPSGELGSSTYECNLGPMRPYQMQPGTSSFDNDHQENYPDPTALGQRYYAGSSQEMECEDFVNSYRRGMMQHVEENLQGDVNLYNATDPEFHNTLQAELQAEWRRRIDDPNADPRETSALEALRGEFGN